MKDEDDRREHERREMERREADHRMDRIEERMGRLELDILTRMTKLNGQVDQLIELAKEFVTTATFTPVKLIVYGLTGLILTSVFAAILAKIITK